MSNQRRAGLEQGVTWSTCVEIDMFHDFSWQNTEDIGHWTPSQDIILGDMQPGQMTPWLHCSHRLVAGGGCTYFTSRKCILPFGGSLVFSLSALRTNQSNILLSENIDPSLFNSPGWHRSDLLWSKWSRRHCDRSFLWENNQLKQLTLD